MDKHRAKSILIGAAILFAIMIPGARFLLNEKITASTMADIGTFSLLLSTLLVYSEDA